MFVDKPVLMEFVAVVCLFAEFKEYRNRQTKTDGDGAGKALFRLEPEPLSGRAGQFFHGREFGDDLSVRAAVSVELAWGEQVDDRHGVFMGLTEGIQKAFLATLLPESLKGTAYGILAGAVGTAALPSSFVAGLLWDKVSLAATF